MMNIEKLMMKIFAVFMVFAISFSSMGLFAYADSKKDTVNDEKSVDSKENTDDNSLTKSLFDGIAKDETVYVIAKADGSVKNIIVSDWIKNGKGEDSIVDNTKLENINNTKGDEKYTINAEGMKVWASEGNDIYYQGTIEKTLPVDVKISYYLDGENISAEDVAGKSGKVTIRFDYTNNEKQMVDIDGKQTELYVPFLMLTGTILDGDSFKNVEVSNGKVINDGSNNVVVGYALPGLNDSLNIDYKDIEIPEYVEISADVTDFQLSTTMTVALNDIFSNSSLEVPAELKEKITSISDASSKLVEGAGSLLTGVNTLADAANEAIEGIGKLKTGIDSAVEGASTLDSGITTAASKSNELSTGAASVLAGAEKIETSAIAIDAATGKLSSGINELYTSLNEKYQQLTTGIAQLKQLQAAIGLNAEQAAQLQQCSIQAATLKSVIDNLTQINSGAAELKTNTAAFAAGTTDLKNGAAKVSGGAAQFVAGMKDLSAGSTKLKAGLIEIQTGANKLNDGGGKLSAGIATLQEGTKTYSEKIGQFDEEAIQKIVELYDGNIETLVERVNALGTLSKNYNSFAGISDDMDGNVKFIYKTDSIEK